MIAIVIVILFLTHGNFVLTLVGEKSFNLFFSNETCILAVTFPSNFSTIVCQEGGNIVALDTDIGANLLFWSNNNVTQKGIYTAGLDGSNITRIVKEDVLLVNGLVVDSLARVIYWTDSELRYVQSCDYDGKNRRIVIYDGLIEPRGLVVDHINGWLIWGDQGRHTIEISKLDGTNRRNVSNVNITKPNQLVLHKLNDTFSKLYFVDAGDQSLKSLMLASTAGDNSTSIINIEFSFKDILGTGNVLFGIAVDDANEIAYISTWGECSLIKLYLLTNKSFEKITTGLGKDVLFSLSMPRVDHAWQLVPERSPNITSAVNGNVTCLWPQRNNCSHVCIPLGYAGGYRCSCPTYGGLAIYKDANICTSPSSILIYADMTNGHVGWLDPLSNGSNLDNLHLIGRSSIPVGVAYDPIEKYVYWSDAKESKIYRRYLNASEPANVFLGSNQSIGTVDGLLLDWVNRKLYFTNEFSSTIDKVEYLKHIIDTISLDGQGRRTVVTSAGKPRGLWIDYQEGYLYYTDWGSKAKVVRSYLDGTNPLTILNVGVESPNAVIMTASGEIFVIDSREKSQSTVNSANKTSRLLQTDKRSGLYSDFNWTQIIKSDLKISYGLATSSSSFSSSSVLQPAYLFISDWGSSCIWRYDVISKSLTCFSYSPLVKKPAGVFYADLDQSLTNVSYPACKSASVNNFCGSTISGGICLSSGPPQSNKSTCYCPSIGDQIWMAVSSKCQTPENFFLIADMMSIRMLGVEMKGDRSLYDLIQGGYSNSYSAIAYHSKSNMLFYSDVNSGVIMAAKVFQPSDVASSSGQKQNRFVFYNAKQVIDDMLIYGSYLYWTAYDTGQIARLNLINDFSNWSTPHEVLASGLSMPKSLAIHESSSNLYWVCDGSSTLWRMNLTSNNKTFIGFNISTISNPGGMFIDQSQNVLYLMDKQIGIVIGCNLTEIILTSGKLPCVEVAKLPGVGGIFYGLAVYDHLIYHSNWMNKAVYSYNTITNRSQLIAGDLTRPTRFLVHHPKNISDYCLNSSCANQCIPVLGDYFCSCLPNELLSFDGAHCISGQISTSNLAPYFINCPRNKNVFTTKSKVPVWWKSPILSGIANSLMEKNIAVNIKPGSQLDLGPNTIRYSAADSAGHKVECSFNVTVSKLDTKCPDLPAALSGEFICSANSSLLSCRLSCMDGFIPLFPSDILEHSCISDKWNVSFSNGSDVAVCLKSFAKPVVKQLQLLFAGSCPSDPEAFVKEFPYALTFTFYSWGLCSKNGNYKSESDMCNRDNIYRIQCLDPTSSSSGKKKRQTSNSDQNVLAKINLWKSESSDNQSLLLHDLVNTGQLKVNYNNQQIKAMQFIDTYSNTACPLDSVETTAGNCLQCSYGTMYSLELKQCLPCPQGTYQPENGQTSCIKCPSTAQYSYSGSYDTLQCQSDPVGSTTVTQGGSSTNVPLIVGLVVGLGGGLLLILLGTLFYLWYKRKRERKMELSRRRELNVGDFYSDDAEDHERPVPLSSYRSGQKLNTGENIVFGGEENRGYRSAEIM